MGPSVEHLAAQQSTSPPELPSFSADDEDIEITLETDDEITGSLELSGKLATEFSSEVTVEDGRKFTTTQVEVGELTTNAERSMLTQTVVSGASGERITAEQKQALAALSQELDQAYGVLGSELPPQEDLLVRIVSYYAEAPVGFKLGNETTQKASVSYEQAPAVTQAVAQSDIGKLEYVSYKSDVTSNGLEGPTATECAEAETLRNSGLLDEYTTFVACQRAGGDGIRYLSCGYRTHKMYWDSRRLCYGFRGNKYTGPRAYRCRGQCGANCHQATGPPTYRCRGWGAYTRDCAEHDDCSYRTNASGGASDSNCGDEFKEARDDFLNARINCNGRC